MAEERLLDDDIDGKSKFRILTGDDGEDELVIDDGRVEQVVFEVAGDEEQDEEDPEVVRERQKREAAEREERRKQHLARAVSDLGAGRFSTALEHLVGARECGAGERDTALMIMRAYTRDFTDFTKICEAAEYADEVSQYSDRGEKDAVLERAGGELKKNISALGREVAALDKENRAKKAERGQELRAARTRETIFFLCSLIPLLVCVVLAAVFGGMTHSSESYALVAATIVCAVLAVVAASALIFTGRRLSRAIYRVKLNRSNSSTKLGREFNQKQARLRAFTAVYSALRD